MVREKTISGKIYPDKSFSIGLCKKTTIRDEDKRYEIELSKDEEKDYGAIADWLTGTTQVCGKFQSVSESPLFIKSSKLSRDKRGSYGSNGITGFGRKVVKNTCILLERKYGRRRLGFVTCTLPNLPVALHHRINGVWGEVVRRFYQKLRRQLEKVSKPFIYTGVTEIQEKRFHSTGVPAPHLHFVYVCRSGNSGRYWLYVCQIHRAWNEAIREGIGVCGYPFTMSQLPGWGSVHCKTVRKSAAAYLGKYLSKGGKVLESMKEAGWTEFPRQWWTACKLCKKMFKESIIRMDANFAYSLLLQIKDYILEGTVTWARYVVVEIGGEPRIMGVVGTLSDQAYQDINPHLNHVPSSRLSS